MPSLDHGFESEVVRVNPGRDVHSPLNFPDFEIALKSASTLHPARMDRDLGYVDSVDPLGPLP